MATASGTSGKTPWLRWIKQENVSPVQLEDRATFVRTQQKRRNSPEDNKSSNGGSVGCESQTVGRIRVGGAGASGGTCRHCRLLPLLLLLLIVNSEPAYTTTVCYLVQLDAEKVYFCKHLRVYRDR